MSRLSQNDIDSTISRGLLSSLISDANPDYKTYTGFDP
jgi:hypothetical protein